jgi:hypothetical protein
MADEETLRRLDKMVAILQLAHHDEIEHARERIRSDDLNAAILDAAARKTPAGKLTTAARAAAKGSPSARTIQRRIASLVDQGALEQSGAGGSVSYEATGLV